MALTLHVPVRSYVYKYCSTVFGEPGKTFRAWYLDTHYKEGKVLFAMLERAPFKHEKEKPNDKVLDIFISTRIVNNKGSHLSQESIELFNDYIKQLILDEILYFHTGIQSQIGLKAIDRVTLNQYQADKKVRVLRIKPKEAQKFFWQKTIISDILSKYDITEDEISTDSITKYLQRNCHFQVSA